MQSQRGEAMNIEEDLRSGDKVRLRFFMNVHTKNDKKGIEIMVKRIIKQVDYAAIAAKVEESESESDEETEKAPTTTADYGTVSYD
jgi:hypothetical protein